MKVFDQPMAIDYWRLMVAMYKLGFAPMIRDIQSFSNEFSILSYYYFIFACIIPAKGFLRNSLYLDDFTEVQSKVILSLQEVAI